jgi:RHS repeat-associated protein
VVGLVNASNQEVARYRYDPFGAVEYSSDPTLQPLGYHAAYRDAENLVYLTNRWYDPELQRFVSEDPIGLAGGINRYTFVGNGPMDGRDPAGTCPQWLVDQAIAGSEVAQAACPGFGGSLSLPGLTATATQSSWPFSTPRSQGYSASFGNRGPAAGSFSGSSFSGNGGASRASAGFTPTANNPAPGVFSQEYSDAMESPSWYADPVALATGAVGGKVGAKAAGSLGLRLRIGVHAPHHTFGRLGPLPHIQANWWRTGVKGSGGAFRVPFPRSWY